MITEKPANDIAISSKKVLIPLTKVELELEGVLIVPEDTQGIVIFAHGSGSSRHSPRNKYVAKTLNDYAMATLLIDLLSAKEERIDLQTRHLRFDIPMLADRLIDITKWIANYTDTKKLDIGYFSSGTGAAAALIAAAKLPLNNIKAIVSRGGRPDLASNYLTKVKAPTLLLVGERDPEVIKLNKEALELLNKESMLEIIPRASHLFEESGTLEEVAHMASAWFKKYLT